MKRITFFLFAILATAILPLMTSCEKAAMKEVFDTSKLKNQTVDINLTREEPVAFVAYENGEAKLLSADEVKRNPERVSILVSKPVDASTPMLQLSSPDDSELMARYPYLQRLGMTQKTEFRSVPAGMEVHNAEQLRQAHTAGTTQNEGRSVVIEGDSQATIGIGNGDVILASIKICIGFNSPNGCIGIYIEKDK